MRIGIGIGFGTARMGNSRNCVNHDRRQQNARNRDYVKRLEKTVKIKTNIN